MNGGENKIVTHSATQLPNGGKQPVSNKLVIAVVSLAILTFLGILSETSLNIAYSTPMEEFSIGASVVQWLVTVICSCCRGRFRARRSWCANSPPKHCSSWPS